MYAAMTYGSTVRDVCRRLRPQELAINERKLVLFGVLEGLIRRVYKVNCTISLIRYLPMYKKRILFYTRFFIYGKTGRFEMRENA